MLVEIYADIVFFINFFVNAVVLYIAGVLCRKGARLWRLALGAAAAAALYTILIFTPAAPWLSIFTSPVIFAPAILIAHGKTGAREFFVTLLATYVTAFALGGAAMATMHIFGGQGQVLSTYSLGMRGATPQNLIVAIVASFVMLKFARRHIFKQHLTKQAYRRFKINLCGKMAELTALVDTGNSLVDPISQNPVIIAEFDKIKELLPPLIAQLFHNREQDDLDALTAAFTAAGYGTRIRLIPYSAIGKSGIIVGIRPDKVEIIEKNGEKSTKDVLIGICDFKLSNDGKYHALMNPLLCD